MIAFKYLIGTGVLFLYVILKPVPYEGENGIGPLLNKLADRFGWGRVYQGESAIPLQEGLASFSLEPGGQFELSGAPLEHRTKPAPKPARTSANCAKCAAT